MCCCASGLWRQSESEKQNWSFSPTNAHFWGNLKESTMPSWSKLASIATVTILLNWAQHEKNTIEYAHCLSLTQVILLSLQVCARTNWWKVNHENFFFNKICRSLFKFVFFLWWSSFTFWTREKVTEIIPEHTYKSTVSYKVNSNSHRRSRPMVGRVKHKLSWFKKYTRVFPVTICPQWSWVVTSDSLTCAVLFKDSKGEMLYIGWAPERPLQLSLSIN